MSALHSLRTHAVSIRAVRKVYGDPESGPVALKRVDLDIRDNEFFTLLGPSGCGKTTLLRMIAGFEFPTEGEILLYGENIAARPPFERPVNTVFQHYALFPHMSIAENPPSASNRAHWDAAWARRRSPSGSARCSPWCRWNVSPIAVPGSFQEASSNAWHWPVRWRRNRGCCCSTNRSRPST